MRSKGEFLIGKILQKLNIVFEKQKTFPDLLGDYNTRLRFDFAIFDNNHQCFFYFG